LKERLATNRCQAACGIDFAVVEIFTISRREERREDVQNIKSVIYYLQFFLRRPEKSL